ncbi:hypothetical protein ACVRZS_08000 [Streptococcus ferus]|uniref:Uncharacterized protein n=1 Tax=Streptococcus ferus TaxID=1345 RepID=A0A2X3XWG2_9STRE|nr:hypothetical protein [Streptococcus ferus]SQF39601.1 Uncharacterised protein [Streptococcus ferus]
MNREDWLDYFEAINGRTPSAAEIAEALAANEFQDYDVTNIENEDKGSQVFDTVEDSGAVSTNSQLEKIEGQNPDFQTASAYPYANEVFSPAEQQSGSENQALADFKVKGKNYFVWFMDQLKAPQIKTQASYLVYGLITLALAALFLAWGYVNYIHRIFTSVINMTISGESLKLQQPELFSTLEDVVDSSFGFTKVISVSLIILVAYLLISGIPSLIHKVTSKSQTKLTELVGQVLSFTPLLAVINLLALAVSFMAPNKLVVYNQYSGSILSSISSIGSDPLTALAYLVNLIKKIPAVTSAKTVLIYLVLFSIVGLAILLVVYLGNVKSSFGYLNHFYVSLIALFIFVVIIYVLDKTLLSSFLSGIENFQTSLKELY